MLSQRQILVVVMIFYGLIMISPVLPHLGIHGTLLTGALFAALFVVFRGIEVRSSYWFLFLGLTVLILACMPTLFWMDARYALSSIFLIFSLFLLQSTDSRAMEQFLTLATALMLVLLIGAIIGFVLALNGVQPLFEIANPNGKLNYFYYTTFSTIRWGNVIRPSGFYDEPGAFSFMICAVSALRHLRGRDARTTWLMLGMGFITLSLAHLVYVLLHVLAERLRFRNVVGIVATLLPIMLLAGYLGGFEILEKRLFSRATITESGQLLGDNRSWRMVNAAEHLSAHPKSIFFGADPSCRFEQDICKKKFPEMGENPLSPLVSNGIFVSWPYFLTLAFLFIAPVFGRKYMVSFAFGALLLQRPFMLGIGYSLIGLLVIATTVEGIVANRFGGRFLVVAKKHSPRIIAGHT
jgi:hypothetical protein